MSMVLVTTDHFIHPHYFDPEVATGERVNLYSMIIYVHWRLFLATA